MRKRKANALDDDDDDLVKEEEKENIKTEVQEADFSVIKGCVPNRVKLYLDLLRKEKLVQRDIKKCTEDCARLANIVTAGAAQTDEGLKNVTQDTIIQYEIIRSHLTKIKDLQEQMSQELVKLGVDEFVKNKFFKKSGGFMKNGVFEVYAFRKFKNKSVHEGEFKNGLLNGMGYCEWPDTGDKYYGEFHNHNSEGHGTYLFGDGSKYVGEFKNGYSDGKGVLKYQNGDIYDGEWKDDKKHGRGCFTFANGDIFKGKWTEGICDCLPQVSNLNFNSKYI